MAKCPSCAHDVHSPFFFDLDAWTHLACPQCKARLEMKAPRSFLMAPLMSHLFVLALKGPTFENLDFAYSAVTIILVFCASFNPNVKLRQKPCLQTDVRLNMTDP